MKALTNLEFIADAKAKIFSPCSNALGEIYFACQNGKILKYKEGHTTEIEAGQEPSAIAMDAQCKKCYIADMAHSSLYVKEMEDKSNTINELATGFEGEPFLGPHSLALSEDGSRLGLIRLTLLHR